MHTLYLSHISQCTIPNRNVQISVLKGVLWDMEQVYYGIREFALFNKTEKIDGSITPPKTVVQ